MTTRYSLPQTNGSNALRYHESFNSYQPMRLVEGGCARSNSYRSRQYQLSSQILTSSQVLGTYLAFVALMSVVLGMWILL